MTYEGEGFKVSKVDDYRVDNNDLMGVVSLNVSEFHAKYIKIYDPQKVKKKLVQTTKLKLGWTLAKQILVSDQTLLLLRQEDYTPFADKKQTKFGLDDNSV